MTDFDATSPGNVPTLDTERRLKDTLAARFPFLDGRITIQRVRRVWANLPMSELTDVIAYAKDALGYDMLCTITGTDEGAELGLLYHLAHPCGVVLTLVTTAPKDGPGPSTITPIFPLAELYEREVVDLLGANIQGLPAGNRYPLPDGWPEGQYPLRKDWKPGSPQSPIEKSPVEKPTKEKQG